MTVFRTDLGSPAAPRPMLLPRNGSADRTSESPRAVSSGQGPQDPASLVVSAAGRDGLRTEPAIREEVVAAARAAVASGELLTRSAAQGAAAEFLRSTSTYSG